MKPTVRSLLERFATALIDGDYETASNDLASWVGDPDGVKLQAAVEDQDRATRGQWSDQDIGPADSFEIDHAPVDPEELRDDGVPLPTEITSESFVLWACVSILADDEEWALYDLWCAVSNDHGTLVIGYYEVSAPD